MTSLLLLATILADPPLVATTPHRAPHEERAAFRVPDGFEVQLVAAEPDIAKPVNMAFDARGRLWVTCTTEYPFPADEGKGRDAVKVLSDFDANGRAQKVETFADGLNIPIGILPYRDGAIVYSIPNIWFLRDTDGDGKCDKREILYSGFGHADTHGMVNGFFMGFDGWVYACHGYRNDSKVKGTDGHEITMNSGNVFRFRPDGSRVELFARGQVNPFGSCMDKWGNLYTACCHSKPINLILRGACYESFGKPHDGLGFAPAMVHQYRGSTALCGLAWYEADYFPRQYQECFYLGDVINNCVNRFSVEWVGATPTAHQQADFMTSSDPWFRPCDIKLGPDGALYIADFYNRIIGHYEVPLGHPGRDRTSGRVWRVIRRGKTLGVPPGVHNPTAQAMVKQLASPNITARLAALSQVTEIGDRATALLSDTMTTQPGENLESAALWALARLKGIEAIRSRVLKSLRENQYNFNRAVVRTHCARILHEVGEKPDYSNLPYKDMESQVRRFAVEYCSTANDSIAHYSIFEVIGPQAHDPVLRHTVRIGLRNMLARPNGGHGGIDPYQWDLVCEAAVGIPNERGAGLIRKSTKFRDPAPRLSPDQIRHVCRYADCDDAEKNDFFVRLELTRPDDFAYHRDLLKAVHEGFTLRGQPMPTAAKCWAERFSAPALRSAKPADVLLGIEVAALIENPGLANIVTALAEDPRRPPEVRAAAVALAAKSHTADVGKLLADAAEPLEFRIRAAEALGAANSNAARDALLKVLPTAPTRLARAAACGLAATRRGAEQLCDAAERGQASPRLLLDPTVRPKLDAAGLQDRVTKLTRGLPPADIQLEALIAKRRAGFANSKPDLAAGKELFTKQCAICHQVGGQGAKLGPQLDGIGVRGLDRLLEDVLDPSRNVDPAFRATTLQLNDGRTLIGLVVRDEGQSVVLADSQGKEITVRKDQIEERSTGAASAMPANVGELMGEAEFHSLMAYVLSLRK